MAYYKSYFSKNLLTNQETNLIILLLKTFIHINLIIQQIILKVRKFFQLIPNLFLARKLFII